MEHPNGFCKKLMSEQPSPGCCVVIASDTTPFGAGLGQQQQQRPYVQGPNLRAHPFPTCYSASLSLTNPLLDQDSWLPLCDYSKLSAAKVIVESVTPIPAAGQEPTIVLRNTGGRVANITGWKLRLGDGATCVPTEIQPADVMFYIADSVRCRPNGTLPAGGSIVISPKSDSNPCGFPFSLGGK